MLFQSVHAFLPWLPAAGRRSQFTARAWGRSQAVIQIAYGERSTGGGLRRRASANEGDGHLRDHAGQTAHRAVRPDLMVDERCSKVVGELDVIALAGIRASPSSGTPPVTVLS